MGLSKAFDYIHHDLRIAKLHAHGLLEDVVTFILIFKTYITRCENK